MRIPFWNAIESCINRFTLNQILSCTYCAAIEIRQISFVQVAYQWPIAKLMHCGWIVGVVWCLKSYICGVIYGDKYVCIRIEIYFTSLFVKVDCRSSLFPRHWSGKFSHSSGCGCVAHQCNNMTVWFLCNSQNEWSFQGYAKVLRTNTNKNLEFTSTKTSDVEQCEFTFGEGQTHFLFQCHVIPSYNKFVFLHIAGMQLLGKFIFAFCVTFHFAHSKCGWYFTQNGIFKHNLWVIRFKQALTWIDMNFGVRPVKLLSLHLARDFWSIWMHDPWLRGLDYTMFILPIDVMRIYMWIALLVIRIHRLPHDPLERFVMNVFINSLHRI